MSDQAGVECTVAKKLASTVMTSVRVPGDHLLGRHVEQAAALAPAGRDVGAASALDDLSVDRSAVAGLQAVGLARKVDPWALRFRHRRNGLLRFAHDRGRLVGECAGAGVNPEDGADELHACDGVGEASINQQIGDPGLLLYPISERHIGRIDCAEVDDEIRLGFDHDFEVSGIAAPR